MKKNLHLKAFLLITLFVAQCYSRLSAQTITATTTNTASICYNDGTLTINASGGIAPYTDTIISGPVSPNLIYPLGLPTGQNVFTNLPHGTYTVVIHDAAGHSATITASVAGTYQFPLFTFSQPTYYSPNSWYQRTADTLLCTRVPGTGRGAVQFALSSTGANSGFGPYQTSGMFLHLCPGTYWVRMRDSCGNIFTDNYLYHYDVDIRLVCVNYSHGTLNVIGSHGNRAYRYTYHSYFSNTFYASGSGAFIGLPTYFSGYVSVYDSCGMKDSIPVSPGGVSLQEFCPFDSAIHMSYINVYDYPHIDSIHLFCTDCIPPQAIAWSPWSWQTNANVFSHVNSVQNYHIIALTPTCGVDTLPVTLTHPSVTTRGLYTTKFACNSLRFYYFDYTIYRNLLFDSFLVTNNSTGVSTSYSHPDSFLTLFHMAAGNYYIKAYRNDPCYNYLLYVTVPQIFVYDYLIKDDSCRSSWEVVVPQSSGSFQEHFSLVTPLHDTLHFSNDYLYYKYLYGIPPGQYQVLSDSGCVSNITLPQFPRYLSRVSSYITCSGNHVIHYADSTMYTNYGGYGSTGGIRIIFYNSSGQVVKDSLQRNTYYQDFNFQFVVPDSGVYHYKLFIYPYAWIYHDSNIVWHDTICPVDTGSIYVSDSRIPYPYTNPIYECGRHQRPIYTIYGGSIPYTVQIPGVDTVIINTNSAPFPTDSPGNYTMIVYDNCGISRSYSFGVIDTCPVIACPGVSAGSDVTICLGASDTVRATANSYVYGDTYIWSSGGNTQNIVVSPTVTTQYTVTMTANSHCAPRVDSVTVFVIPPLSLSLTHDTTICQGLGVTLSAPASATGGSYLWSPGGSIAQSISVSPTVNTTYRVTYSLRGCLAVTDSVTVTVSPPPTLSVLHDTSICTGSSANLTASASLTGGSYLWTPGGATTQSVSVSPSATTTYSVTYSQYGCSATDTARVRVIAAPVLTPANVTICNSGSTSIGVTPSVTGGHYLWSPSGDTTQTISVSPAITTVYAVSYTTLCGTATASDTAFVGVAPSVSLVNINLCLDSNTTLTAVSNGSGGHYLWTQSGDTTQSITVSPRATASYTVSYTTLCGTNSATDTVFVLLAPHVALANTNICSGSSTTLTATPSVPGGHYHWTPSGDTTQIITAAPAATAFYTVSYTTLCGIASATDTVTVILLPSLSQETVSICSGTSATLTATANVTGGHYLWTPGGDTTMSISVSPATRTIYTVSYITACGTASVSDTVNVIEAPNVSLGNASICAGTSVTLTATTTSPGGQYLWAPGGYSTQSITVSPVTTTSYTVTYAIAGCTSAVATDTVTVNPLPILTLHSSDISCYGIDNGYIVATVTPSGTYTYQWSNGATGSSDSNLAPGVYRLTVTDANHCSASDSATIHNVSPASLEILPTDTTVFQGTYVQLNSYFSGYPVSTITSYVWTPSTGLSCINCPNPMVNMTGAIDSFNVYSLVVTYNNGCVVSSKDTIRIDFENNVVIPTAFTPNGDGNNDSYYLRAKGVKTILINIYNRWGQLVFSSDDITKGWDGNYKGSPQPSEAYMVIADIGFYNGKSSHQEQSIMLFR